MSETESMKVSVGVQRLQAARLSVCRPRLSVVVRASAATQTALRVKQAGSACVQGTSRKRNEDRFTISVSNLLVVKTCVYECTVLTRFHLQVSEEETEVGEPHAYAGVFDGHGETYVELVREH